jgi:hypothetical protein
LGVLPRIEIEIFSLSLSNISLYKINIVIVGDKIVIIVREFKEKKKKYFEICIDWKII